MIVLHVLTIIKQQTIFNVCAMMDIIEMDQINVRNFTLPCSKCENNPSGCTECISNKFLQFKYNFKSKGLIK
ncbi:unnamed protein product [Paramecium sonneborni]|uniref:Uncharacterized protein n=1 Tax=Paramecium sonneborni TaxID=65129 RepID=A0A8S1RP21_9CILI|nr:unnamed protein product [Paramecium sonneborni]